MKRRPPLKDHRRGRHENTFKSEWMLYSAALQLYLKRTLSHFLIAETSVNPK